ncbi:hypothetical protein GGI21_002401 [Coemansia aciculifera]|uniref:Uncharacterized protein n=1 Tax=Coemansia aciculifera TaxID=417176 RepID=A0ACC1M5X8_9FUNG|nr:hypothetical protein IWW38_001568 [Coemansia aciculifera]KAJ2908922.1 hypothetical protein GGI21_002401 [Coemansia aciculifera]
MDSKIQRLREEGKKSDQDLQDMETLSYEIQNSVREKRLCPVVRTFYNRTAFQLPGDARVRISLDTELTMVREDSFDGKTRAGNNWRRTDIGIDFPFPQLPEDDVCRFPYAVLEVKLQTQSGVEPPQWVTDLIDSHLVEAVPKFSKFIHGTSVLLEDRVEVFPFWFSQMDRDIRKPVTKAIGVSRASSPRGSIVGFDGLVRHRSGRISSGTRSHSSSQFPNDIEVIVENEPGERSSQNDSAGTHYSQAYDDEEAIVTATEGTALLRRERQSKKGADSAAAWLMRTINPFAATGERPPGYEALSSELPFGTPRADSGVGRSAGQRRIAVPVRVEPKVFFANERTFLSWLNFAIVLGSLALGLLNFGDRTGKIAGAAFTLIAMFVMVYALVLFQWRAERIRQRDAGPYDDRRGPTVLVVVLIAAVVLNFYLKVSTGF